MIADSCWMWSMILDKRTRHDQLRGSHHQGWCQRRTLGFHPKLNKVFLFERNFTKRKLGESAGREPGPIFSPSCFSGDMWKWSNLHNIPQGCSGGFPFRTWIAVLALEKWNTLDLFILWRYSRLWRRTYFLFLPFYLLSYLYAFSGSPFGMINLSHSLLSSIICEAQTSNFHLWAFILSKMQCW